MEKIFVQRDLCDGCLDCENACNSIHNVTRIRILDVESEYYPIVCQQCENAPCERICPSEAIDSNGVDEKKCIGCGLCQMVCPFGAITIEKTAEKCNLCVDNENKPVCIDACSKRAISKMDIETLKKENQEKYIAKLSGNGMMSQQDIVNLLTIDSRAKKD